MEAEVSSGFLCAFIYHLKHDLSKDVHLYN